MKFVCDHLVIGGGIAGTSVAAEIANYDKVILLEREPHLGYHTTGRSAAIFLETYGSRIFRLLTQYSRDFYYSTMSDDRPLISPRGALFVARQANLSKLDRLFDEVRQLTNSVVWLSAAELRKRYPCLSSDWVAGVLEPDAMDIDVHEFHQHCIKRFRSLGGEIQPNEEVLQIARVEGGWETTTKTAVYRSSTIVNAAGAWVDHVAHMAGVQPLNMRPLKRSAILAEVDVDLKHLPYIGDVAESFYFKPGADGVMISPCDEILEEPNDTTADDLDVATAVDRFESATERHVVKVRSKWAGLRTFAMDRNPVVGFEPGHKGFFWLAGQGGYGIQTAPAIAQLAAAMIRNDQLPAFMAKNEFALPDISPSRFRRQ